MAEAVSDNRQKAAEDIIAWYDSTRPRFIDLVGDYAVRNSSSLREMECLERRSQMRDSTLRVSDSEDLRKKAANEVIFRWLSDTSCCLYRRETA